MRIIRFLDSVNQVHLGVDQGDGTALRIQGDVLANHTVTHQKVAVKKLLAPLVPAAILCIGLNYRKHAEETGAKIPEFPVLFMKNPGAVQNPGDPIALPTHLRSGQVDWECELAIVIGKRAKNVSKERALEYVLGYTCGNDVSARDWQRQWGGSQWCKGKGFDTFCPLGPVIETEFDAASATIETRVNGDVRQSGRVADLIHGIPELVAYASSVWTLLPGDVIMTGTPAGVGPLAAGDRVEVTVSGIGTLSNPVRAKG